MKKIRITTQFQVTEGSFLISLKNWNWYECSPWICEVNFSDGAVFAPFWWSIGILQPGTLEKTATCYSDKKNSW